MSVYEARLLGRTALASLSKFKHLLNKSHSKVYYELKLNPLSCQVTRELCILVRYTSYGVLRSTGTAKCCLLF